MYENMTDKQVIDLYVKIEQRVLGAMCADDPVAVAVASTALERVGEVMDERGLSVPV